MPDDQPPLCQGYHHGHLCHQPVLPDNGRIIHRGCRPTLSESVTDLTAEIYEEALSELETIYGRYPRRAAQAPSDGRSEAPTTGLWPPRPDGLWPIP